MDRKKLFGYFDRNEDGYLLDTVQGEETESIGEHGFEDEDDSENENDNGDERITETKTVLEMKMYQKMKQQLYMSADGWVRRSLCSPL